MKIQIRNCNNIDFGTIYVEENCLNIKYAINGTGKTTIATALENIGKSEKLNDLLPYQFMDETPCPASHLPEVLCDIERDPKIAIFNEDYVNQYIFVGDELIKGSFDIFVKTPDYDRRMEEIRRLTNDIYMVFIDNPDIENLLNELSTFVDGCGKAKKGYSKSSIFGKGLGQGNKIENVPEELKEFQEFIQGDSNIGWIAWQGKGQEFAETAQRCPYCAVSMPTERKTLAKRVGEEYDSKVAQNLLKMVELLRSMEDFFVDATKEKLHNLISNVTGFTKEQEAFIGEVRKEVEILRDKLVEIKAINFSSLKDAGTVAEALQSKQIDITYLSHLNNTYTKMRIEPINKAVEKVLQKATLLQAEIGKQKSTIRKTIEQNQKEIDGFLENAGYKYHVELEESGEVYRLVLKSNEGSKHISNVKSHLSYGERNAFALVLFMYNQLKTDADLIILDDPISSFDKNKKYAILDMLFRGERSLRGKTVMMLTHDFDPVVDLIYEKSIRRRFSPSPVASFLWNEKGELKEKEITPKDIVSFYRLAEKAIRGDADEINKLIYWRRRLEACGDKGIVWDIISSLLHAREKPKRKNDYGEEIELKEEEIERGIYEIRKIIPTFDYQEIYNRVKNPKELIYLYRKTACGYEKIQLYRLIDADLKTNPIIKKYIDEAYHVENDSLFS